MCTERGHIMKSGTNLLTCAQLTTYSCCFTDLCNENSTDFGNGTLPSTSTNLDYEFSFSTNFMNGSSNNVSTRPSTLSSTDRDIGSSNDTYNRAKIDGMSFFIVSTATMVVLYQTI